MGERFLGSMLLHYLGTGKTLVRVGIQRNQGEKNECLGFHLLPKKMGEKFLLLLLNVRHPYLPSEIEKMHMLSGFDQKSNRLLVLITTTLTQNLTPPWKDTEYCYLDKDKGM